jgi:hypothetical protein
MAKTFFMKKQNSFLQKITFHLKPEKKWQHNAKVTAMAAITPV